MKNKIKVVIADDHQIFIEGIKALIKDSDKVTLVGEATDGEALLTVVKSKNPDVVLMDINMPKMNGIEASKKLKATFPDMKIVGLTMSDDATSVSEMMKAGVLGYLLKTTSKAELINAILRVYQGEKYLSNEMSMKLIEKMFDDKEKDEISHTPRKAEITRRELDIIRLVAQEMTNAEIAKKLNNSPMTIITHRKNLLRKLGVRNTAGLVKYAVINGLLES